MAPEVTQRCWINGEANHGGYGIPWLQRWHKGAGFMGKQGAETIHAHINKLETSYWGYQMMSYDRLKKKFF